MKIIREGQMLFKAYNVTCNKCDTLFQMLEKDAVSTDGEHLSVTCPLCCMSIEVPIEDHTYIRREDVATHMNPIALYIFQNWDALPKSSFNDEECVIFDIANEDDAGWGNHSFEGYGVTKDGTIVVATSSGCSCEGSCCMEPYTVKMEKEKNLEFNNYNPDEINFSSLQRNFSDY